mgnify:FL=1
MKNKIEYNETNLFQKDLKHLLKKFPTLKDDIEIAKKNAIELYHINKIDNQSVFPIQGFCTSKIKVYKLKKFACKALKGRGSKSGIRIIYAFHLETSKVVFIQLYFKGEQLNEDKDRIKEYLRENR